MTSRIYPGIFREFLKQTMSPSGSTEFHKVFSARKQTRERTEGCLKCKFRTRLGRNLSQEGKHIDHVNNKANYSKSIAVRNHVILRYNLAIYCRYL